MPTVHTDTMLSACASQARPLNHLLFSLISEPRHGLTALLDGRRLEGGREWAARDGRALSRVADTRVIRLRRSPGELHRGNHLQQLSHFADGWTSEAPPS